MRGTTIPRGIGVFILLLTVVPSLLGQVILVHSPLVPKEEEETKGLVYQRVQYGEAGIFDALFSRGYIVFSDPSNEDLRNTSVRGREAGADYVLRWSLKEGGARAELLRLRDERIFETVEVTEGDFRSQKNTETLYLAMGSALAAALLDQE